MQLGEQIAQKGSFDMYGYRLTGKEIAIRIALALLGLFLGFIVALFKLAAKSK